MGKETKDMLSKIIANQALILKQLQTNHEAITSSKNEGKAKPVTAKKAPAKKVVKKKK